ncbi:SA1002 family membrane protein [Canibacter oris]|uniref:Uncharacterized protein n=1 Tax=Canibacter oris TaxID=1365628 RepID=A0A840DJ50_9MICO|nr:hypothetical protein [Canibacter oris]MBB4071743.1 hypothetical protein [Canibacter oris]
MFFNLVQLVVVIGLLYAIGRLTYGGVGKIDNGGKYKFINSLVQLLWMFCINGFVFALLAVFAVILLTLYDFLSTPESYQDIAGGGQILENAIGSFPGGAFLLTLLILIFATAIVTFLGRKKIRRRTDKWQLNEEGYEIGEYFIQWITIYLAVYQFFFDGLQDLIALAVTAETAKEVFDIALSPRNINLIAQPVLISTWILVVMEKLRLRNSQQ